MDPEAFLDIANQVVKLKMFPYFDIAYCVLCALSVREDLGNGKSFRSNISINILDEFRRLRFWYTWAKYRNHIL